MNGDDEPLYCAIFYGMVQDFFKNAVSSSRDRKHSGYSQDVPTMCRRILHNAWQEIATRSTDKGLAIRPLPCPSWETIPIGVM